MCAAATRFGLLIKSPPWAHDGSWRSTSIGVGFAFRYYYCRHPAHINSKYMVSSNFSRQCISQQRLLLHVDKISQYFILVAIRVSDCLVGPVTWYPRSVRLCCRKTPISWFAWPLGCDFDLRDIVQVSCFIVHVSSFMFHRSCFIVHVSSFLSTRMPVRLLRLLLVNKMKCFKVWTKTLNWVWNSNPIQHFCSDNYILQKKN